MAFLSGGLGSNAFQAKLQTLAPKPQGGAAPPTVMAPSSQPAPIAPTFSQPAPAPTAVQRPQEFAPVLKAPMASPSGSGVPTDTYSSFGPGNSLIAKQIAPSSSGPNNFDNEAAQYARNASVGDYSGQTQQARDMILAQLQNLQNAPDRLKLAQDAYDTFQQQSEPAYQQALRGVGQKAAALGRVGAGMTTNDLTGTLGQRQLQLSGERQNLINNANQNTLNDRLNIYNAIQGGASTLGGQDLSLNTARSQAALGQAGVFGGLGQNQAQREANSVQQQMQQQQYQAGLDQQNIQNQIAQQQLQMSGQNQTWQQQFAQQQLAAQIAAQQNTQYPGMSYPGNQSSAALGAGSVPAQSFGVQGSGLAVPARPPALALPPGIFPPENQDYV